ncbi:hypothetical protein F5Y19DRAFT_162877 [Xylariaceae sp. FL1651]|nr:hypothetical protein F5Y19DRAFT_162877 [Xylariaceae sp. FL1651]
MGRARKNRRSRFNHNNKLGKSNTSGNLDRDDDFPMHGVEHTLPSNERRTPRPSDGQNSDSRGSKNRSRSNPFANPFNQPGSKGPGPQDQSPGTRQQGKRTRNQGRRGNRHHINHNDQRHNHHQPNRHRRGSFTSNSTATTDNDSNNHSYDRFFTSSPPFANSAFSSPSSPSPGRRVRFCTECSTVRRANLTLRDWLASALFGVSEVVDIWGAEVGVGRGSGDEMDWQPEPVIHVLVLATAAAAAGSSWMGSLAQQPQHTQQYGGLQGGGGGGAGGGIGSGNGCGYGYGNEYTHGVQDGAAAPGANCNTRMGMGSSQWGLRPGVINPWSSTGGSVWGGCGLGTGGGQSEMNTGGVWQRKPFTQQFVKMLTPPESPSSLIS